MLAVGQNGRVLVRGKITNKETGAPISGANVMVRGSALGVTTNSKGEFKIRLWKSKAYKMAISHISYVNQFPAWNFDVTSKDTVYRNIALAPSPVVLDSFSVSSERKPEVVFKSTTISVADFELFEDKMILLTYEKRLKKDAEVILADKEQNVLARANVPCEAVEMFTDYLGRPHVICRHGVYRIEVGSERLDLLRVPTKQFYTLIKPCLDTLDNNIVFSDFLRQFPRFKYYLYSPADTTAKVVREIVNKQKDWEYAFEYQNLTNAQKAYAMRIARRSPQYDKYDIAAMMTGFANDFMYEEAYSPLFSMNDTMYIFDLYNDKLAKYHADTAVVAEIPISYHKPKKWKEWKKQMHFDEAQARVHALFQKQGYYYLKEISLGTGKIVNEKKLTHKYVEKMQVRDGYVYYVYRPYESLQKKFLYKEKL